MSNTDLNGNSTNSFVNCDPNTVSGSLLQVANNNTGLTGSIQTVYDAVGNASALGLATNMVRNSNLTVTGTTALNSLTISTGILAVNQINIPASGNSVLTFADITSAVNHIEIANESTGQKPAIYPAGSDTNIGLSLQTKGTGAVVIQAANQSNPLTMIPNTGALSNSITFSMAPTGSRVWTWQDSTDSVVGRNTTDTFTNKSFDTASNTFKISGTAITGISGTGDVVLTDSPTLTSPTLTTPILGTPASGVITNCTGAPTLSSLTFSSTSGIIGTTTNNSAAAGSVGEVISSQIVFASRVTITSTVAANITSISLTAGDWDCHGFLSFAASSSTTAVSAGISTTSATFPDGSLTAQLVGLVGTSGQGISIPTIRLLLATTTTIYLVGQSTFTGTGSACGILWARRAR